MPQKQEPQPDKAIPSAIARVNPVRFTFLFSTVEYPTRQPEPPSLSPCRLLFAAPHVHQPPAYEDRQYNTITTAYLVYSRVSFIFSSES